MIDKEFQDLLFKYFYKTALASERKALFDLLSQEKYREQAQAIMENLYNQEWEAMEDVDFNRQEVLNNILLSYPEKKVIHWRRWSMYAASVLFVLGLYFFFQKDQTKEVMTELVQQNDIPAGGNKAVLTLGDGKRVILDGLNEGAVLQEGPIKITKSSDGQLTYSISPDEQLPTSYNSVETPTGGFYQIHLPDGTHVWLNSRSSLRFPTAFTEHERRVELTGEGYFEVAKNPSKPFIVMAGDTRVQVLGTHFNINSYAIGESVSTTVLEGKVAVGNGQMQRQVIPGQQLTIFKNKPSILSQDVDLSQVVAWKDGYFCKKSIRLEDLMNEVERWYGVDVQYQEPVAAEFVVKLRKDISLKELLTILELTGEVKFNLTNKTLKVMKTRT